MAWASANERTETFRPRLILSVLMALGGLLWLTALGFLLSFGGAPWRLLCGAGFFVAFFSVALAYYGRTKITVDRTGVTYRGVVRSRRVSFEAIRGVQVVPGLVTVYAIRAQERILHFTSFFRHHQRLAELLIERARLGPVRSSTAE